MADFVAVGKLNGALIEAGTINAESLSVEYKQSVKKYTDDGDAKLLSEMKSRFEVTGESITAEVERAQAAEKTISDDLELTKQDAEDFKENVEGAFRDGIITETEAQTIERYIKELEKDNASIQKQYNAVLDSASRQSATTGSNFSIKFNAECKTEISSSGTKYDYLYLFYQKDGKIYKALDKVSGADIAGKTYIVPSTDVYIQWYSDGSGNKYYGFSIDEIKQVSTAADTTGTESTLPTYEVIEAATVSMIQTSHPYENSMRKLWHYKKRTATRPTLISKKNAYTNAYNALITAINNAISDKKITATEKANVNTKFDAYNAALADLKETIEAAGVDVAAVAAAAVAEYARAAIKVEADKIELRVTSAQAESLIEQKADSIRLKASKIAWSAAYSSMSESGILKCTSAELKGTMKCGYDSGYWVELAGSGRLTGGYGSTQYGYIDYSASATDIDTGARYNGIQVQGGCMRISVNQLSTRKTSNVSTLAYIGATGKFKYISSITARSDGGINWVETTVNFENGLLVSSL